MKNIRLITVFVFSIIFSSEAFAQEGFEHLSPVSHGAGRTYVVSSRGLSAVGLNPALLGIDNGKTFEIQIFPLSAFGIDAGAGFSDVNALSGVFSTKVDHFTDSALTSIAGLLSDGKLSGRGDAEILGAAFRVPEIGTFALTWTTHGAIRTEIPQNFLDFAKDAASKLLTENNTIDNFDIQGMWYNEYSASFGTTLFLSPDSEVFLKNLSVGGALKYVSGIAYIKFDEGNYIHTTAGNAKVTLGVNFTERSAFSSSFDPKHAPNRFSFDFLTSNSAGSGFGFDLGACVGLWSNHGIPTVLIGASATDIGSIIWNTNATERKADHLADTIYGTAGTTIKDLTDSLAKLGGSVKDLSSFSTPLPAMFRAGVLVDLAAMGMDWGVFEPRIAVEYANGLTNLVGSLKSGRIGAGISLERPGNVGLRLSAGFASDSEGSDITAGVGITIFKLIDFDIATSRLGQFFKSGASRTDLAFNIRAAF
ncbi:MAG: DUF5723 family protein [bacterium]